jgi:magnesium-transporting ATPase (P-type)
MNCWYFAGPFKRPCNIVGSPTAENKSTNRDLSKAWRRDSCSSGFSWAYIIVLFHAIFSYRMCSSRIIDSRWAPLKSLPHQSASQDNLVLLCFGETLNTSVGWVSHFLILAGSGYLQNKLQKVPLLTISRTVVHHLAVLAN